MSYSRDAILFGPFKEPIIQVDMVDGDFDSIIRVTAATIIVIVIIVVFVDFPLLLFLIFISTPWRPSYFLSLGRAFRRLRASRSVREVSWVEG